MKEDRRVELPLQTRLAPIAGVDAKARVANLVWSTGARVRRQDFWTGEQFFEELSMDPAHIRLGRLNRRRTPSQHAQPPGPVKA
jgi:hypothetical protein